LRPFSWREALSAEAVRKAAPRRGARLHRLHPRSRDRGRDLRDHALLHADAAGARLLPASLRANPAIFPPPDVLARLELIEEVGEATVLYDRLWTEVKSR